MFKLRALFVTAFALLIALSVGMNAQASPKSSTSKASTKITVASFIGGNRGSGTKAPAFKEPTKAQLNRHAAKIAGQNDCYGEDQRTSYAWTRSTHYYYAAGGFCLSDNVNYRAVFQEDGNFVVYRGIWNDDLPVWSSRTQFIGEYFFLSMSSNIEVLDRDGNDIWSSWSWYRMRHQYAAKVFILKLEILGPSTSVPSCTLGHYLVTEEFFRYAHSPRYMDYQYISAINTSGSQQNLYCFYKIYK